MRKYAIEVSYPPYDDTWYRIPDDYTIRAKTQIRRAQADRLLFGFRCRYRVVNIKTNKVVWDEQEVNYAE